MVMLLLVLEADNANLIGFSISVLLSFNLN